MASSHRVLEVQRDQELLGKLFPLRARVGHTCLSMWARPTARVVKSGALPELFPNWTPLLQHPRQGQWGLEADTGRMSGRKA